jgi:hypothetical protein
VPSGKCHNHADGGQSQRERLTMTAQDQSAGEHLAKQAASASDGNDPKDFSDTLKVAILSDASQWALENRERLHRARRNLMMFATVTVFVCIVNFKPQDFEAYGVKVEQIPDTIFFLFVAVVNIYLYWSYRNILNVARSARLLIDDIYANIIDFEYLKNNSYENSKISRVSYNYWRNISPTIACSVATLSCFARIFIF